MPHSFGYRARTRDLFSVKNPGQRAVTTYLRNYKLGDIVDVVGDGSQQKGMPHKTYHGRTGIVWNVTKRAIGVEVNKTVGNRVIPKRIHVRVEHVKHSKCRKDFLDRVQANDKKRAEAKKAGVYVHLKRVQEQPREAEIVKAKRTQVETLVAVPYEGLGW